MALPAFTMRQLLEAGCHFGHQSHRWNPKMAPFIFGSRNNIHIIDLAQTVPLLHQALVKVSDVVAGRGRVLFVGTAKGLETKIVPREGFELDLIRAAGLKGKSLAARLRGALLIPAGFMDAWKLITRRRPAIATATGYATTVVATADASFLEAGEK